MGFSISLKTSLFSSSITSSSSVSLPFILLPSLHPPFPSYSSSSSPPPPFFLLPSPTQFSPSPSAGFVSLKSSWTLCTGNKWGVAKTICLFYIFVFFVLSAPYRFTSQPWYRSVELNSCNQAEFSKTESLLLAKKKNLWSLDLLPRKGLDYLKGWDPCSHCSHWASVSLLEGLSPFSLPLQILKDKEGDWLQSLRHL